MNRGRKVVDLWGEENPEALTDDGGAIAPSSEEPTQPLPLVDENPYYVTEDEFAAPKRWPILATLLSTLAVGWVAAVIYWVWPKMVLLADPLEATSRLLPLMLLPIILLGLIWVVARRARTNAPEAYASLLARLHEEQTALANMMNRGETRLVEGMTAMQEQVEQLDAVGETALKRIATLRAMLGEEIGQIGLHTNGLKNAAAAARSDMAVLLANLPKAHIETRKMVVALQNAGLTAQEQAQGLSGHLLTLSQHGEKAQEVANVASETLAGHLTHMESQAFSIRSMVQQSQTSLAKVEADSAEGLKARIHDISGHVTALGVALSAQEGLSEKLAGNLRAALADVEGRLAVIDTHGTARTEQLAQAVASLSAQSQNLQASLATGGDHTEHLISKAEALMVTLGSATHEVEQTLPAALTNVSALAQDTHAHISGSTQAIAEMEARLIAAKSALDDNGTVIASQRDTIESTRESIGAASEAANVLSTALGALETDMNALSHGASAQLVDALLRVRQTAEQASERAREALQAIIPDAAAALGEASRKAVQDAVHGQVEAHLEHVSAVSQQAVEAADKATERLMRQMLTIVETGATFDAQLKDAERAQESKAHTSLSRRVSLLIESLNSISIDVTKILSNEVTDSAWASYLKGDRGIFTRRAVKLLDGGDTREILRHYDNDPEFRDHVNHYIHDFEAMLRAVLSSRESGPLSVTLLSSDMGKLYVALAHAIERLRA